jgi:hypothetical protein
MREIERRVRKLEDIDPTRREKRFAISDCPEDDLGDQQVVNSMDGGRVIYLLKEGVMSAQEWADRYCTPD